MIMPYLLFEWGRGKYDLRDIIKVDNVEMSERGVSSSNPRPTRTMCPLGRITWTGAPRLG